MIRNYKRFMQLSVEEKKLFVEAYFTLGMMRISILTVSFKHLTQRMNHSPAKKQVAPIGKGERDTAVKIGEAVTKAAAHTPWESACLVQALTVAAMLRKRGIPGLFYLGVAKEHSDNKGLKAHAWSLCGDRVLTGEKGCERFRVISSFGWLSNDIKGA